MTLAPTELSFSLSVGHLQLDSQLPSAPKTPEEIAAGASAEWCQYPVMLVPSAEGGEAGAIPSLSVSATVNPSYQQVVFIQHLRAAVAPLNLRLEQNTIARLSRLAFAVIDDVERVARVAAAAAAAGADNGGNGGVSSTTGPQATRWSCAPCTLHLTLYTLHLPFSTLHHASSSH